MSIKDDDQIHLLLNLFDSFFIVFININSEEIYIGILNESYYE
jgi:hypothetical protein